MPIRKRTGYNSNLKLSFLRLKNKKKALYPSECFLHSATQVGTKILICGGADCHGVALNQIFLFDTINFSWSVPPDVSYFQEGRPGSRYGHTSTLIEMHPPKILVYGGIVGSAR